MAFYLFFDAGLSTNKYCSSHVSFISTFKDVKINLIIVLYVSTNYNRFTSIFLAADLFSIVHLLDVSSPIFLAVNDLVKNNILLQLYTDSRSIYEILIKICNTA